MLDTPRRSSQPLLFTHTTRLPFGHLRTYEEENVTVRISGDDWRLVTVDTSYNQAGSLVYTYALLGDPDVGVSTAGEHRERR